MTKAEKAIIEQTNHAMIAQARNYMAFFHTSLMLAAQERDRAEFQRLAEAGERFRDRLANYIDLCEEVQHQEVIQLHDFFVESTANLREAIKQIDSGEAGEEWKKA